MEIKNSKLLDLVIEKAKCGQEGKTVALTYERFFSSLIGYVFDPKHENEDQDFVLEITETIAVFKEFADIDWLSVQKKLDEYNSTTTKSFMDSLSMQKLMLDIKEYVSDAHIEILTAAIMAKRLLETPTKVFISLLPVDAASDGEDTDISEGLQEIMNKKFDEIFGSTHGEDCNTDDKSDSTSDEADKMSEAKVSDKKAIADIAMKVKHIQDELLSKVYGQDNAISVFASGYFQSELLALTDKKRFRPRATYLFAGPPGVGKTYLAEKAAEALGLPFKRFDMSEYVDKEANLEFCGTDKVYKNGKPGNVTDFVDNNPHCILLFDEIEKAHINVIHLFLQLLDAGRLRDNFTDKEVSFKDSIIIFTTNAGKQLYTDSESGDYSGVSRKVILKALSRDTDPENGVPYFPAALCSRFATGNVVMFNHIGAHNLREIAKKEIQRHVVNFESEVGIKIEINEDVYTALLLSEGGNADARTIRARAESFFDDELYELFRLMSSDKFKGKIDALDSIRINVTLPIENTDIVTLFKPTEEPEVLLFASSETALLCRSKAKNCAIVAAQTVEEGRKAIKERDIKLILIDPQFGKYNSTTKYLNMEDVESKARDFFLMLKESGDETPVYLLQTIGTQMNAEEKLSFTRAGIRGIISINNGIKDSFANELNAICGYIHQQDSMRTLAKANKLLTFGTAQTIRGKRADIKLYDLKLIVAVEAEDSKNILSGVSKPNVKFDAVIGAEDAKRELKYFVEYLKNPKKYVGTGVSAPRGVLLYGPPGTGKTMLAKAMACESDVTFIAAEGNQFLKKWLGEGQEAVHELFRTARKYAPAILFIDEIDAIAKERRGSEGGDEQTLTAFLTEMDGFKNDPSKPVFVLAATNFNVEPGTPKSLDSALMRRFDRKVYIDLPTRDDRIKYIRLKMAKNKALAISDAEVDNIAMRSTGMSLAELESVIELSLRSAIRADSDKVTDEIFEEAFETHNGGDAKKWDISQLERVARHETGHAFICYESGETPSYITIVARGDHGGYMQHADNEGKAIYTKNELLAKIRISLGGRAAEIVYYGADDGISTGASGDLASATDLAYHMICSYGMSQEFGLAVTHESGEMSKEVRAEINKILSAEMKAAITVIQDNREIIDKMVDELMKKNHLNSSEIDALFRLSKQK